MADYRFPGEHQIDGVTFQSGVTLEALKQIRDFEVHEGDILIASYPKTGTTWVENVTWLCVNSDKPDSTPTTPLHQRIRYLEFKLDGVTSGVDHLRKDPRPAIMKTHLMASHFDKQLTEAKLKVVVVIRNPKDTLASFYNFYRMCVVLGKFPGSFDDFFELYKAKRLINGDYFDWYNSWLPYADRPNVLLVHFEEMKFDMDKELGRFTKFLGKSLSSDALENIVQSTTFDAMKRDPLTNYEGVPIFEMKISPFIRKGSVGDWKNYFNEEQSAQIDKLYWENIEAKGVKLRFE